MTGCVTGALVVASVTSGVTSISGFLLLFRKITPAVTAKATAAALTAIIVFFFLSINRSLPFLSVRHKICVVEMRFLAPGLVPFTRHERIVACCA